MLFVHDEAAIAEANRWDGDDWRARNDAAWARMKQEDQAAKDAGTLLGRFFQHGVADGYAVYQVVKVNKRSVRAQTVPLGDGYVLPAWGPTPTVPHATVLQFATFRDRSLFGRA